MEKESKKQEEGIVVNKKFKGLNSAQIIQFSSLLGSLLKPVSNNSKPKNDQFETSRTNAQILQIMCNAKNK